MDSRKTWPWLAVLMVAAGLVSPLAPCASAQEADVVGRIAHTEGQVLHFVPETQDWVATVKDAPADKVARLSSVAEVWALGWGSVDLRELLSRLEGRGIERLLVEGGGELNWGFVRDDLFDELYVTIAPALLGGRDAPTLCEGEGLTMAGQRRLKLVSADIVDNEIFCRYAVIR